MSGFAVVREDGSSRVAVELDAKETDTLSRAGRRNGITLPTVVYYLVTHYLYEEAERTSRYREWLKGFIR